VVSALAPGRKVGSRSKITKALGGALTELASAIRGRCSTASCGSREKKASASARAFAGEPGARLKGTEASTYPVDLVRLGLLMKEDRSPTLHCGNLGH
jgi:hypothetical protein